MKVFISRALEPASTFRQLLEPKGIEVSGESFVVIKPLPIKRVPPCDWIFFSSKNGVDCFFNGIGSIVLPSPVKWASIGPGTASALAQRIPSIDFTGTGDPRDTANLFSVLCSGQTVLFPSAKHSLAGVQKHLPATVTCLKLEVYDNQPVPHPAPRAEDVLVFTSPVNALAYFSANRILDHQRVVAIGKSTFSALQKIGIERLTLSPAASEEALAQAVLRF